VILAHYVALVDVPAVLHGAKGFVRTLGARVLSSSPDQTVLRLDAGPELHNHVGGPRTWSTTRRVRVRRWRTAASRPSTSRSPSDASRTTCRPQS
jgi:hypothetical protein